MRRRRNRGLLSRAWRSFTRWLRWGTRRTSSDYARFMASPAWASQRARVLRRDGSRCRACGGRGREVHHNWYAVPLAATPDAALTTLCEPCHRRVHADKRRSPTSRRMW
jgi:5-methylcytosine-specific restriction endonuclease McrA